MIVNWITKNVTNADLILIYQKWIGTESNWDGIIEAVTYVGEQISSFFLKTPGPADRFEWQDSTLYFQVPLSLFFGDLLKASNNLAYDSDVKNVIGGEAESSLGRKLDIPSILGFDEMIDDLFGEGKPDGEFRTVAELEQKLKNDPEAFAKITAGAQGVEYKKPTDEELISLRQCALVTRLLHNDDAPIKFGNYFNDVNFKNSPLNPNGNNPGHSRIYPVDPSYDPNMFYNKCNISFEAKQTLEVNDSNDVNSPTTLFKTLWWVFESIDGSLKEIELALTQNDKERKEIKDYYKLLKAQSIYSTGEDPRNKAKVKSLLGEGFDNKGAVDSAITSIISATGSFDESDGAYYFLKDLEIKYEGTNPSTARDDVQVQMTFELSSMKALQCVIATVPKEFTATVENPEIKLYELITLPNTNKVSKGPGAYLKNQYSPEYSRVRLKVFNGVDHKSDLIIDLSTIDHSISRSSDTGATTLTINYRGFFEAMMNMPFNDALASEDTLKKREEIHGEAMSVIQTKDCKPELINKAMRIEQEIFRRETKKLSANSILTKLTSKRLIHGYTIKEDQLMARAVNGTLDAFQDYVTGIAPGSGLSDVQIKKIEDATDEIKKGDADKDNDKTSLEFMRNKFFFLGDLLYHVSGCLYKSEDSAEMRDIAKNMNIRFILGSFNVPNPKTRDGSMITINPACIPIDLAFFIEWFNSTIVNKGLTTYPVGIFIKELVERLVNNIIFEVCFSSLLPSETPPVVKVQFMSNFDEQGWFLKDTNGWLHPDNPYYENPYLVDLEGKNIFIKDALYNTRDPNKTVYDVNPFNYCVIYQQFPTFSHYTVKDKTQKLRNKSFVPTIFYGAKNTRFNYVSDVSFSKTDSPFLREARYFNSNYGNLSLLSNVYDLGFSFSRRKANTYFYPGIIINFVLLDWDASDTVSPYVKLKNNQGAANNPSNSDDYTVFGQANPHSEDTLAHILGFGGYFIVKSVVYKLGQTEDVWDIQITTKFMGTDAAKNDVRKDATDERIEDKSDCVEAYNSLTKRARDLAGEGDEFFTNAVKTKEVTSNNAVRQPEVPEESLNVEDRIGVSNLSGESEQ